MVRTTEVICAGIMLLCGICVFVHLVMAPRRASFLKLSFIFYTLQFTVGPALFPPYEGLHMWRADSVLKVWMAIGLFWITCALLAWLFPTRIRVSGPSVVGVPGNCGYLWAIICESYRVRISLICAVYVAVTIFRLWLHFRYRYMLSGDLAGNVMVQVPYAVRASREVLLFAGFGLAWLAAAQLLSSPRRWLLPTLVLGSEFLFAMTRGRRWIFALGISYLVIYLCQTGRLRMKHAIIIVITAVLMWQVLFPLFTLLRYEWQVNPARNPIQWLLPAIENLTKGETPETLRGPERLVDIRVQRLRAIEGAYSLIALQHAQQQYLGGRLLAGGVLYVVPSVIFPSKAYYSVSEDTVLSEMMGSSRVFDVTTHLPLSALADFGVPGAVVYGIVFFGVIRLFELMFTSALHRGVVIPAIMAGTFSAQVIMQMEFPVIMLAAALRAAFLCWIAGYALSGLRHIMGDRQSS